MVLVTVLLAVAAAGCGTSPTSPLATGGGTVTPASGPQVLKVNADGSVSFVSLPPALLSPTPIPLDNNLTYDPRRVVVVTARVDGAVGGRVICGRFVATVPAGAFAGVGTITMTLPDSTLMLCDLEVSPAELNGFAVPVDLALHTSGTGADLDSLDIYWWDPANSAWTSMGCQKAVLEPVLADEVLTAEPVTGVSLQLNHFSKYAAGKAGW
jgi:hypothetical protein